MTRAFRQAFMLKKELEAAIEGTSAKLNQMGVPPVRRLLMELVFHRDPTEHAVQRILEECRRYPPMVRLLERQQPDGTWPISRTRKEEEDAGPGPPYGWTYITMLRNLYMLFEYGASRDMGHIEESLELILSWQDGEGFIRGPERDRIPRPHYNGLALGDLAKFGMNEDRRTGELVRWLLKTQRRDGGWSIPYIQDMKHRPEYRYMRISDFVERVRGPGAPAYDPGDHMDVPSCIWSTVGAIRGLGLYSPLRKDRRVKRGAEFVLDRFFKRNYHASFYQSEKNWTMLKFPTYFGSGITALDCIVHNDFGPEDERMEKPIRWLLGARSKDGLWHRSERPHPIDDQWISAVCLYVLADFHAMY